MRFEDFLRDNQLPDVRFGDKSLTPEIAWALFGAQCTSRALDIVARELKTANHSFYTIGSSGHEGNAAIAAALRVTDPALLHYRSGAFYCQRACQQHLDPVELTLLSLMASRDDPIAQGRHKVWGHNDLHILPQTSTIASHLPKSVGMAYGMSTAKTLHHTTPYPEDSVVVCSFGDASCNHASAQSAFNLAAWISAQHYPLPLLMVCEDNGLGISVPTPPGWIKSMMQSRAGIHYLSCDGLSLADTYVTAQQAAAIAREKKQPVFLHMHCVRLYGHAGSDLQENYLTPAQIHQQEANDPLLYSAGYLIENGVKSAEEILAFYQQCLSTVREQAQNLLPVAHLQDTDAVMQSIIPSKTASTATSDINSQQRDAVFSDQAKQRHLPRTMAQCINYALRDLCLQYDNMVIFGEDVGKKGGVYHVTAHLQHHFGHARVFDTLLDETSILGTAIGMSQVGLLPIPEIQFLAYLHNAEDQLRGEAATCSFFSNGQYRNPMVVRIASFAYQQGFGGHFHNDNSIAVLRDIPGVIIATPSNGVDAAKMLRECVRLAQEEGRVCIFLEPIALYGKKDLLEPGDQQWLQSYPDPQQRLAVGDIAIKGDGNIAIISYANGFYMAAQAQQRLKQHHNIDVRIIDCRWLAPLPLSALLIATQDCKHIIIVDECRRTGSISEALVTMFVEKQTAHSLQRITARDSFIPLGLAAQTVLPCCQDIIDSVLEINNG